ncbi:6,7-dimethyl-8-ribityllumazine synthase, partial [Vibrio cholerae]|nr:6,7-dimethyl-8-ribityllumazine synthase [Vibrio cholerae]
MLDIAHKFVLESGDSHLMNRVKGKLMKVIEGG